MWVRLFIHIVVLYIDSEEIPQLTRYMEKHDIKSKSELTRKALREFTNELEEKDTPLETPEKEEPQNDQPYQLKLEDIAAGE